MCSSLYRASRALAGSLKENNPFREDFQAGYARFYRAQPAFCYPPPFRTGMA